MRKSASLFVVVALFVLPIAFAETTGTILIKNGHIVPVVGPSIENGSLLIRDGKIVDIGTSIKAPSGAQVIDARGKFVYPGMVAPLTAIGVTGYPRSGNDTNETGVSTPHMDPYDALNPEDDCVDVTRIDGVTTVLTVSGSRNVLNGKAIALNLEGNLAHEMLLKRDVAQVFNMGAKRDGKYPSTLQGVHAFVRDKLYEAKRYAEKKEKNGDKDSFKRDLELEALVPVVIGEMPGIFLTADEVTLRNALRIIEEYDLKGIIQASADILKYADQLAEKKIPVIWNGTTTVPRRWETVDLNYHTAAVLAEKGVLFAFSEGRRGPGSRNVRRQPVPASLSVAYGLSEKEAIKALTINPAKILGIDDKVGSLEKGKIANVVISSKSLIQMSAKIDTVIINGKVIPMTSVQTRLRDKYEKIVKERMKKKTT
jgi:imidazolonepropionase-like amidohydrolase